jgi:hypothetical protein
LINFANGKLSTFSFAPRLPGSVGLKLIESRFTDNLHKKGYFVKNPWKNYFSREKCTIMPSTRIWLQNRELCEDKRGNRGSQNHFLTALDGVSFPAAPGRGNNFGK